MKLNLKDKVVVITGASSGIGAATAIACAQKGALLSLASRNEEKLVELVNTCSEYSIAHSFPTDVSQEKECKDLIDQTIDTYGRIDVLICNAGLTMRGLAENTDTKVFQRLMDVNFWGVFYCTQFAMPHLLESKGMLVGISSVSGFKALPGRSGYTASKHAMNGFLECVKIENLKTGVHVLTLCPGFTATNIRTSALNEKGEEQPESPRDEAKMMLPEEVAHQVCSSIEQKKDFVVLTKQGQIIYWLDKFAPNFVSKKVFEEFAKEPDSPLRMKPLK